MRLNEAINLLQCKENNNMNGELINRRNCTFGKQLILKKIFGKLFNSQKNSSIYRTCKQNIFKLQK